MLKTWVSGTCGSSEPNLKRQKTLRRAAFFEETVLALRQNCPSGRADFANVAGRVKYWMLWSSCALGTRTLLWFRRGCSGHHMLLEHERYYGLGMDALVIVCSWNTNVTIVWAWMLESSYAFGTGALSWAWMLWSSHAFGTRTLFWFGHAWSGHRMLLEHERYDGLGVDALVTKRS